MQRLLLLALPGLFSLCMACSDQPEPVPSRQNTGVESEVSPTVTSSIHKSELPAKHLIAPHSRALFDWFDSLGVPVLNDKKYLQIYLGHYRSPTDEKEKPQFTNVFLLDSHEAKRKVFTLGMRTTTYSGDEYNMLTGELYRFKEVDLGDDVIQRLKYLRAIDPEEDHLRNFGKRTSELVELFILARGCYGNGLNQQAEDLIEYIAEIPDLQTGKPVGREGLKSALSEDMAKSFMWSTVLDFRDPEVQRREILQSFLDIVKYYPQSKYSTRARKSAEILSRMIQEDEAHSRKTTKSLEVMTPRERVAELIYQLRDQNGIQIAQPGSCDIFGDPRDGGMMHQKVPGKGSPATQLIDMGEVALEQLIDAVDDNSFTRCVEYHRNFYFSHHVIRVGECCQTIIDRIQPTGRRFDIKDNPQQAKAAMKVWYLGN